VVEAVNYGPVEAVVVKEHASVEEAAVVVVTVKDTETLEEAIEAAAVETVVAWRSDKHNYEQFLVVVVVVEAIVLEAVIVKAAEVENCEDELH
jgi:hypothetical protein